MAFDFNFAFYKAEIRKLQIRTLARMDDLILVRIALHNHHIPLNNYRRSVVSESAHGLPSDDKSEITMEGIHNVLCQLRLGTPNAARLDPHKAVGTASAPGHTPIVAQ